jgi:ribosomal protein S18 acetylase RimI-like enzyme
MNPIVIVPLTPARLNDYLRFFDTKAFTDNPRWAGCYCYFPLHDPRTTQWPKRSAVENRTAIGECIGAGKAEGVLAYVDGEVAGWCNAGPHRLYPMLDEDPAPDAEHTGVVFCFVVAPEHRGKGIARTLLDAACSALAAQGMRVVVARPRRAAAGPAANHVGPLAMYLAAGFTVLREDAEGNVYVQKRLG